MNGEWMIETRSVSKRFRVVGGGALSNKTFEAVGGISLQIARGETFGIVGESGCGKSTVARLIMGIEKPTTGEIWFNGQRVDDMRPAALRKLRPKFQMVFQDSASSLNPRKTIMDIIAQPMRYHGVARGGEAKRRVSELLDMVGLSQGMAQRYPHELSGGQRQRVCIAKALSLEPELVVLDEPVSALDVSIQAQILNLIRELQARLNLTCIFIGHGLGAVHYVSHRIAVMYLGRIVETGTSDQVFEHPAHPYTKALLDAAPIPDDRQRGRRRSALTGEVSEVAPVGACCLYPRCPIAREECLAFTDGLKPLAGEAGHCAACARAWEER